MTPRYFAIGDTHGCRATLEAMLVQIAPRSGDTIVYLGDYIDRGPDSKGVIDLVRGHSPHGVQIVALKGNHEDIMVQAHQDPRKLDWWIRNGGQATLDSYGGAVPYEVVSWARGLPTSYQVPGYFFVHAGVEPRAQLSKQLDEVMLWTRDWYESEEVLDKMEACVVHGHTPTLGGAEVHRNAINIDTGCVYPVQGLGVLTCAVLGADGSREFISIPNKEPGR